MKEKFGSKLVEPGRSLHWRNKKLSNDNIWETTIKISGTQFDDRLSKSGWYAFPEIDDIYRIVYSINFIQKISLASFEVYINPGTQELQIIIL